MNKNILAAHKLASMDSMRCKNVRLRGGGTRKWWSLVDRHKNGMHVQYNEGCVHRVTRVENLEDRQELEVPDAVRVSASVELGMRRETRPTRALVSVIMQVPNSHSLAQNNCKHHSHRDFLVAQGKPFHCPLFQSYLYFPTPELYFNWPVSCFSVHL